MLLAIDIGNTNLVIGCIENDKILFKARIATDAIRTSDQYGVEIKNMMEAFGVQVKDIDDCIISSVVPPVFNSVKTGVIKVIRKQPMVVGPGLKTGLNIHMDVPSQVGSDRIVIAVAALAEYEAPMILMDLGTATTIEVVEPNNMYLGGIIFPGVRVSLDALTSRTAQLPGISLLELAQIGSFDRGTATRAVQKLEELGYIRRVGDPNDRRVVRLYVTEKARPVIEATLAARQRWNDILTQGMTSKQREAAKTLLVAMSQNAHQYVSNDSAPHGRAAHKQADQTGKEE